MDMYRWGAGLAVTGPIRDSGQTVLLSAFVTGSSSSPQLLPRVLPYRCPRGGFYQKYKVIIMPLINNSNNQALIKNNYGSPTIPYFAFQFPWARDRISSKSLDN
jgi:hypothetical protein